MGSAFSLTSDNKNFVKLQDGHKKLTLSYVRRNQVPPNLRIYQCCEKCSPHNSEKVYAYHWAAAHCDRETFYYLLKKSSLQEEYDASVNIRTKSLKTPLTYAALHNKPANVRILIGDLHCEVNSKDSQGQTALHHAARLGYVEVVKELLKSPDIHIHILDRCDNTPLEEAVHYNMKEVAECLKIKGASFVDVRTNSWRRSYRSYTSTLDSGLQELIRDTSSSDVKCSSLCSHEEEHSTRSVHRHSTSVEQVGEKMAGIGFIDVETDGEHTDGSESEEDDRDSIQGSCIGHRLERDQPERAEPVSGPVENTEMKHATSQELCTAMEVGDQSSDPGSTPADDTDTVEDRQMEFEKLSLDQEQIVVTAEVHAERGIVNCYDRKMENERMCGGKDRVRQSVEQTVEKRVKAGDVSCTTDGSLGTKAVSRETDERSVTPEDTSKAYRQNKVRSSTDKKAILCAA